MLAISLLAWPHTLLFACLLETPCPAEGSKASAEQLMIRAHEARALWHDFPGFSADLVVCSDDTLIRCKLNVARNGSLEFEPSDVALPDWARRRIRSLVNHRLPPSRERKFDVSFADRAESHPSGRLIRFHNDDHQSVYRVKGDVITEVHRTMGSSRFTITVSSVTRNEEGKHLPESYSVSWWDAKNGNLTASDVVRNQWIRISHWDLPASLQFVRSEDGGGHQVGQLLFRSHRLFGSAAGQ